jgi:hypothetical protein
MLDFREGPTTRTCVSCPMTGANTRTKIEIINNRPTKLFFIRLSPHWNIEKSLFLLCADRFLKILFIYKIETDSQQILKKR